MLADYATARNALKRGAGAPRAALELDGIVADERVDDLLAVDDVLSRLARVHAGAAKVVECRVYAGMTIEETAEALDLSPATVKRYWGTARVWLTRELGAVHERAQRK